MLIDDKIIGLGIFYFVFFLFFLFFLLLFPLPMKKKTGKYFHLPLFFARLCCLPNAFLSTKTKKKIDKKKEKKFEEKKYEK